MSDRVEKKLSLGVLLSGGGRTLMNILDEISAGRLSAEVAVVVASRQCKGVERARDAGLNVHVVAYKDFFDSSNKGKARTDGALADYSSRITEHLAAAEVELVVMAGFLSKWTIPPAYEDRVINIHPALLPGFGGKGMYGHYVHEAVLSAGCKVSGCTVHCVTNEYDAGPIVIQRAVEVFEGDTPDELAKRVFAQECIAYPSAIQLFAEGRIGIEGRVVHIRR